MATRILVFAGSVRRDSLNKTLARLAAKHCAELGAEATFIDLADYPMPLYDGDRKPAMARRKTLSAYKHSSPNSTVC